jgi:Tol biopolymer transport system component
MCSRRLAGFAALASALVACGTTAPSEQQALVPSNRLVVEEDGTVGILSLTGVLEQVVTPGAPFPYAIEPTVSHDRRHIAFSGSRQGQWDLYVMNADGSDVRQLTDDPAQDLGPRWAPDDVTIAFTSSEVNPSMTRVVVIKHDGTARTVLADDAGTPDWSPDGTRIVFRGVGARCGYFVMEADGSQIDSLRQLDCTIPRSSPRWSPTGDTLAFARGMNTADTLELVRSDGTGLVELRPGSSPVWSPDGKHLAFLSDVTGGRARVSVLTLGTGEVTNVAPNVGLLFDWTH